MLGTETEIQKIERLKVLIEKTREFYGAENEVWCPYFKSKIALTADGFNHLLNKPNRQHRNIDEKLLKLSLLKRGIEVIKLSATVQEYRERFEKVGKASKDGFTN